jgi:hypothetical protein
MRLLAFERAWLAAVFDAVLPADLAGLPALEPEAVSDTLAVLEDATGPTFLPGLRAMLYALVLRPLLVPGLRRPFFALGRAERVAFVARLADEPGYLTHQLVATMKILATFAYFEAPSARAAAEAR